MYLVTSISIKSGYNMKSTYWNKLYTHKQNYVKTK